MIAAGPGGFRRGSRTALDLGLPRLASSRGRLPDCPFGLGSGGAGTQVKRSRKITEDNRCLALASRRMMGAGPLCVVVDMVVRRLSAIVVTFGKAWRGDQSGQTLIRAAATGGAIRPSEPNRDESRHAEQSPRPPFSSIPRILLRQAWHPAG